MRNRKSRITVTKTPAIRMRTSSQVSGSVCHDDHFEEPFAAVTQVIKTGPTCVESQAEVTQFAAAHGSTTSRFAELLSLGAEFPGAEFDEEFPSADFRDAEI